MSSVRIILVIIAAFAITSTQGAESPVIVIDGPDSLAAAAKAHPFVAVEFYAPWCGHCKKLEPEWAKAAAELEKQGINVVLAKADATAKSNFPLNTQYNIRGYPTIKLFKKGNVEKPCAYNGPRDYKGIVKYFVHKTTPAALELTTKKEVEKFVDAAGDVAVVAYVPADSHAFKAFMDMADDLREDVSSAYVTNHKFLEECSIADCDSPVAIMTKKEEEKKPRYQGEFSKDLLLSWADSHAAPLVARYFQDDVTSMKGFQRAAKVQLPQVHIAFNKRKEINKDVMEAVSAAAEANDDLKFFVTSQDAGQRLLDFLKLPALAKTDFPLFHIANTPNQYKYLKTSMKLENLPEFIEEYKVGALQRFILSESQQEVEKSGPVVHVTAETYNQTVFEGAKAVFMMFHAHWCGHCKNMATPWENVAKGFADDDVVIAKMNGAKNDVIDRRVKVESYPTLYWYPKDPTAKPIRYTGPRDEATLIAFTRDRLNAEAGGSRKQQPAAESSEEIEKKDEL